MIHACFGNLSAINGTGLIAGRNLSTGISCFAVNRCGRPAVRYIGIRHVGRLCPCQTGARQAQTVCLNRFGDERTVIVRQRVTFRDAVRMTVRYGFVSGRFHIDAL